MQLSFCFLGLAVIRYLGGLAAWLWLLPKDHCFTLEPVAPLISDDIHHHGCRKSHFEPVVTTLNLISQLVPACILCDPTANHSSDALYHGIHTICIGS